jgi:retinol dehydrogenase-12
MFKRPKYGAYSELFAVLTPEVTLERNGDFIIPWGRFGVLPCDIASAMKPESEGGVGLSEKFWEWCERETASFR